MSIFSKVFGDEKLLEKVATAKTKEDAKRICKESSLEVTDADLDEVAGGLSTTQKVLIGVGAAVGTGAAATAGYLGGKKLGWWGNSEAPAPAAGPSAAAVAAQTDAAERIRYHQELQHNRATAREAAAARAAAAALAPPPAAAEPAPAKKKSFFGIF